MKRKLFLTTLSLGVTSALFIAATTQAADDTKSSTSSSTATSSSSQGATGKGSASISGQSQKFMRLSQLTGTSLKNTSGENLGQINDFVVDPSTGRIEFAVLSLTPGGAIGKIENTLQRGKLTAIPWTLIRPSGEGQNLTANIDKDKLAVALKGANETVRQFFFTNMSSRAAKMLVEDMQAKGPVRLRDVDEAQALLVNTAKDLAAKGEIIIAKSRGEDELIY